MKKLLVVLFVLFLLSAPAIAQANSDEKCNKNDAACTTSQDDGRRNHDRDDDDWDDDDREDDDGEDRDRDEDDRDRHDRDKDDQGKGDKDKDDRDRHDRDDDDDDDDDDSEDRDRDDDDDDDGEDRDRDDDDDDDDGEERDRDDDDDDDEGEDRDRDDDDDDEGEDRDRDDDDDDDGEDRDRNDDDDDDDDCEDCDQDDDDDDDDRDDRDRNDDDDDDEGEDRDRDDDDDDDRDDRDRDDDDDEGEDDDDGDDKKRQDGCRKIGDGGIYLRKEGDGYGDEIILGYDAWGYNYQAHKFQGFAQNADRSVPPALEGKVYLKMKWNDTFLSNRDCDGDHHLDRHYGHDNFYGTNAWITNLYKWSYIGDDGEVHWVHWFLKATAKPYETFDCSSIGATTYNSHFCWVQDDYRDPYGGSHGLGVLLSIFGSRY